MAKIGIIGGHHIAAIQLMALLAPSGHEIIEMTDDDFELMPHRPEPMVIKLNPYDYKEVNLPAVHKGPSKGPRRKRGKGNKYHRT